MDNITYGGRVDLASLDKDWSDPHNKWWLDTDDVEVIDFQISDAEPATEYFSTETIFANPSKQFSLITDKRPLSWSRVFLDDCFFHTDRHTLLKWRDEMYIWRRGAWRRASKDQISKAIYLWGERCFLVDPENNKQKDFNPDIKKVREVIAASTALCSIDDDLHQPSLLGPMEINPDMAVAMQNGVVDLRTGTMLPPSPRFFCASCNKFDFDPKAKKPAKWLKFLREVWGDDDQSIETLQEIFGYLLTSDTSMQKAFMLIGPKRSGKGTIARVLGELIGHDALVSPTLASISTNFGMAPLIGKKLALIADARMSAKTDSSIIAERILSITGEDSQTIDRKMLSSWNGKLVSRFLIMSNILPKFMDASGALTSRMIIIKMTNSFFGREDPTLFERLKPELPGIFLWAMEGLNRLRARGKFVNPASSMDMVQDLADMASPMAEFVRNECVTDPLLEVSRKELYDEWKIWCANNGYREGTVSNFGASLRSVLPHIGDRRTGSDGSRDRRYIGLALRPRQHAF